MDGTELLHSATTVVLVDYPGPAVPETLARAGYAVVAKEGPAPDDYNAYAADGDSVVATKAGKLPAQAEIVYSHRPDDELPGIIDLARQVGAATVWCETGSSTAREIVEAAGLTYVDSPKIIDAARTEPHA